MKLCWITLVLLLGFIISVPINGDTYHYRVVRKICPSGSYHDPIKDRCRKVPGGGEMIKFNFDAKCSNGFLGLLAHSSKSRYYFVCRRDAVLTCMCGKKQHFSRIRLQCETKKKQMTKQDQRSIKIVDDILQKYRCLAHQQEESSTFSSQINFQTPISFRSMEVTNFYDPISHFQGILAELYKLKALTASIEESTSAGVQYETSTSTKKITPYEPMEVFAQEDTSLTDSTRTSSTTIGITEFTDTTEKSITSVKPTSMKPSTKLEVITEIFENQDIFTFTPADSFENSSTTNPPSNINTFETTTNSDHFLMKNIEDDGETTSQTETTTVLPSTEAIFPPENIVQLIESREEETGDSLSTSTKTVSTSTVTTEATISETASTETATTEETTTGATSTEAAMFTDRVLDEVMVRDSEDSPAGDELKNAPAKYPKENSSRKPNATKESDYDFKDGHEHKHGEKQIMEYYEVYEYYYDDSPNVTLWKKDENKTEVVELTTVEPTTTTLDYDDYDYELIQENKTKDETNNVYVEEELKFEATTKDFNERSSTIDDDGIDEFSSTFSFPQIENLVTESQKPFVTTTVTATTGDSTTLLVYLSTLFDKNTTTHVEETTDVTDTPTTDSTELSPLITTDCTTETMYSTTTKQQETTTDLQKEVTEYFTSTTDFSTDSTTEDTESSSFDSTLTETSSLSYDSTDYFTDTDLTTSIESTTTFGTTDLTTDTSDLTTTETPTDSTAEDTESSSFDSTLTETSTMSYDSTDYFTDTDFTTSIESTTTFGTTDLTTDTPDLTTTETPTDSTTDDTEASSFDSTLTETSTLSYTSMNYFTDTDLTTSIESTTTLGTTDQTTDTPDLTTTETPITESTSTPDNLSTATDFETTEQDYLTTESETTTEGTTSTLIDSTTVVMSTTEVTTEASTNQSFETTTDLIGENSSTQESTVTDFETTGTDLTTTAESLQTTDTEFHSTVTDATTTGMHETTEIYSTATELSSENEESTTESPVTSTTIGNSRETTIEEIATTTAEMSTTETFTQDVDTTTEQKSSTVIQANDVEKIDYYSVPPKKDEIEFYYETEEYYDDLNEIPSEDVKAEQLLKPALNDKKKHDNSVEYYVDSISASREDRKNEVKNYVTFNFKIFNFDQSKPK